MTNFICFTCGLKRHVIRRSDIAFSYPSIIDTDVEYITLFSGTRYRAEGIKGLDIDENSPTIEAEITLLKIAN